ncbi:hypothetical protein [Cloacibacterium sp.]
MESSITTRSWKLEAGSWKLEAGSWKLEVGSWKFIKNYQLSIINY